MGSKKETHPNNDNNNPINMGTDKYPHPDSKFCISMLRDLILKVLYILTLPLQYIEPALLPLLQKPEKIGVIMEVILCGNFFLAMGIPNSLQDILVEILLIFFMLIPVARSLYVFMQYIGIAFAKMSSIIGRYGTEWNLSIGRKTTKKNNYTEEEIAKARQVLQLFGAFRVNVLKQKRRELLNKYFVEVKKENFSKAKEINEAYAVLFFQAIAEEKHIEFNQNTLLKFLYYITRPFIYVEQMIAPILDEKEVILGSINILIYVFCFSAFITNAKNETDFAIMFFIVACLMVPILKFIAELLIFIASFILEIIIMICAYMVEFNIQIEEQLFGYKGFDYSYESSEGYYRDATYRNDDSNQSHESKQDYGKDQRTDQDKERDWRQEYEKQQEQKQEYGRNQHHNEYGKKRYESDEEKARKIFGLYGEFTVDELKSRRRNLMKKNHPDQGGSEQRAKDINVAYDILLHLAEK